MKKVLYFYPHKFAALTDGIHTRIVTILQYFKSRNIVVDMVCFDDPALATSYVLENQLVRSIHYASKISDGITSSRTNFLKRKWAGLSNRLWLKPAAPVTLPNLINASLLNTVLQLDAKEKYDAVLITYAYWADLAKQLKARHKEIRTVIDPTDFLTLQQYYANPSLSPSDIGQYFGSEIERITQFDEVIHISYDELLLFSNFVLQAKHHFVPQFFKNNICEVNLNSNYDILFIGSGNPYNVEGLNWFFKEVLPLLNNKFRIAIAGNICNKLDFPAGNIIKLGFVDEVEPLYRNTRITICPLRKGSGMKIKVVESLSFSIPVVCTLKGLDGFFNRNPAGGALLADSADLFADTITRLVNDDDYYTEQCACAFQLFEDQFSFNINFSKLDAIFNVQ